MIKIYASKKENSVMEKIMLLSELRSTLINDKIAKEICKENNIDNTFLLGVPISFDELDVSAKTVDGSILLNQKLMEKEFDIVMRYVIHELVHAIQHADGKSRDKEDKAKDYLDKQTEVDAFIEQIKFDKENRGEEAAEEYVEELLDHHDLFGKKRKEKKEELLDLN
jgi:hypothetical protein